MLHKKRSVRAIDKRVPPNELSVAAVMLRKMHSVRAIDKRVPPNGVLPNGVLPLWYTIYYLQGFHDSLQKQ